MKQQSSSLWIQKQKSIIKLIYFSIYSINKTQDFKIQSNILIQIISTIINLIIFISFKQINIIKFTSLALPVQAYVLIFGLFVFMIVEFFICVVYKVEFYLSIQYKVIRYVGFPFGVRYFMDSIGLYNEQGSTDDMMSFYIIGLLVYFIITFIISFLFCPQSYTIIKIYSNQLSINSHLLIIQFLFYLCHYFTISSSHNNNNNNNNILLLCSFVMLSYCIMIRMLFFNDKTNDYLQYKILSINCFLYNIYAIIISIATLAGVEDAIEMFYMIVPIILYYVICQLLRKKIISTQFNKIFNIESLQFQQFVHYAEHIISQAHQFNKAVHENFIQSITFTFYSEHQKHCDKSNCKFYTQNWREQVKNISDTKILKKLIHRVLKKIQILFQQIHKNEPDNIALKLSFAKFYIFTLPNKIRAIQLLSEVQAMNRNIINDYELYILKYQTQKMDNVQVLDNLKTDQEVNQFQKIAYLTINSIMQFWLQFTEEKIDLIKVMEISQKLLNHKKKLQEEWEKNKKQEKYSTLKIFLLYSYYLRHIMHDQDMAQYLDYNSKNLQQKLMHKKQIKYLSCGSQSALIGASLSDANLGKIVIANNQGSNIFHYSKGQMSKIRVNEIMPRLFSDQHDHYLLQFHKNKYKRINSDQRFLFGRDKQGLIIPILLQLQRTISTISEQLIFVANIKKTKVRQSPLICIIDQQGEITNISSGFRQVFYGGKDKKQIQCSKNIQQFIPKFFQQKQPEDCGNYKFLQTVDSLKYGKRIIDFTVIPIVFPLKPNGGFAVLGNRQQAMKSISMTNISLTKHMLNKRQQNKLLGKQILYNQQKNRYQFDDFISSLSQSNAKSKHFTIPFINLNDMTNIFQIAKQQKTYGEKIRMVRLINGAMIRVQTDVDFQSQQLSQSQKANRFQFKFKQLKNQYLNKEEKVDFIFCSRVGILVLLVGICIVSGVVFNQLQNQTKIRQKLLDQVKFRYQIRGYLSQYILAFQGLASGYNDTYFSQKSITVKQRLINVIQQSSIDQIQKQPILKTIYLKNQADLSNLITSQTLNFSSIQQINGLHIIKLWIIIIAFICLSILFQLVIKILYWKNLQNVYNVFLSVDQKMIKKSYDSCLKFSRLLQERPEEQKNSSTNHQNFDDANQNPVRKMKKYKKSSKIDIVNIVKNFGSLILILIICNIMILMIKLDIETFNQYYTIQNSIYKIFPQSSISLMNSYFHSYKLNSTIQINQNFNTSYQNLQAIIFNFQKYTPEYIGQSFFKTLMNNVCISKPFQKFSLIKGDRQTFKQLCEGFEEGILTTGLGKVGNFIAEQIEYIRANNYININNSSNSTQSSSYMDQYFFNIFRLEYDFYVPLITQLSMLMFQKMYKNIDLFQQKYSIWVALMLFFIGINSFYVWQFLLGGIRQEIKQAKQLLNIIPDLHTDEKVNKKKKQANGFQDEFNKSQK